MWGIVGICVGDVGIDALENESDSKSEDEEDDDEEEDEEVSRLSESYGSS